MYANGRDVFDDSCNRHASVERVDKNSLLASFTGERRYRAHEQYGACDSNRCNSRKRSTRQSVRTSSIFGMHGALRTVPFVSTDEFSDARQRRGYPSLKNYKFWFADCGFIVHLE